jgi:acid stress chaperone HdeA
MITFPLILVFAGTLFADTDKITNSAKTSKKQANQLTCEEFLAIDEVDKPKIIYWTLGQMKKGKPQNINLLVTDTERFIPVVIDECKKSPKKTLWQKLKQHL